MAELDSASHSSLYCVRANFVPGSNPAAMRVDSNTSNVSNYAVTDGGANPIIVSQVIFPSSQDQDYVAPNPSGGAPTWIYLILASVPVSGVGSLEVNSLGTLVDWGGNPFEGDTGPGTTATVALTFSDFVDPTYWDSDGLRTAETFKEFRKLGRLKLRSKEAQPLAYGLTHIIGKINDIMSGGLRARLNTDIEGPADPSDWPLFAAGFSAPTVSTPGIGDTISFIDSIIPCHVDVLWGRSDGTNDLFRTSIQYHPHSCVVIQSGKETSGVYPKVLDPDEWFAPDSGHDRLLRVLSPPSEGETLIAVYVPRQSLLKIGREILAYHESDPAAGSVVICGRSQLCSEMEAHSARDRVVDVFCASFVERVKYALLAFGASGRALEYIGMDSGAPRSDNPAQTDTELRRMIFHTTVTMRATPQTVQLALRYMFPRLYYHCHVAEDPRWPGCLTLWFSEEQLQSRAEPDPPVECWETWLDHKAYPDGFPTDLYAVTYYRDTLDPAPYGDYYVADATTIGALWPYPIVLSGPDIGILGILHTTVPPPLMNFTAGTTDRTYLSYLQRPAALDKVLPCGCGVLILDYGLL